MKQNDLVATTAITRKPNSRVERVDPGQSFTPKDDEERAFLIRIRAARPASEADATAKAPASKKKPAAKKKPAGDDPAPEVKPVVLDSPDEASTADQNDMLD